MPDLDPEVPAAFVTSGSDQGIVAARFRVVSAAAEAFSVLANGSHTAGYILRNEQSLALALLCHIATSITNGLLALLRATNTYAAAALLRQLIEVEYLLFLGYSDRTNLVTWYRSDRKTRVAQFSPQRMRDASGGLFRDQEYWQHCESGGHPTPAARVVLNGYAGGIEPMHFLLPDSVHHLRRLWVSMRSCAEDLLEVGGPYRDAAARLDAAIDAWTALEHPIVLSFDGIADEPDEVP